jgi:capsular polysaccharide biosynthesis protein
MYRPTTPFGLEEGAFDNKAAIVPKSHYEGVVYDTVRSLWSRKWLIAGILACAVMLASVALVLIGPSYTGEATIQLNFVRDEPASGAKSVPTASVDATALVDSAVRVIRSRATASAVVTKLALDEDPAFAHQALSWRVISRARSALGFQQAEPSKHDLAVQQLMRRMTVTNDIRSYLILVSVSAADPERAAQLTNAVVFEYLRGQLMQQLGEAYAAVERDVAELSSLYGQRHPAYLSGQAKREDLRRRLASLRQGTFDEAMAGRVTGQSFVAAQKVMVPSGPNILLVLGLTVVVALGLGIWLAWLGRPNKSRSNRLSSWPTGPSARSAG